MTAPTSPSPDSLAEVSADIGKWHDDGERPDEWKLAEWKKRIERLDAEMRKEIARCHERLEIDHIYEGDGIGGLKRVEVPMAERASLPDAVACRDDTIELQEESIGRLLARLTACEKALTEISSGAYANHALAGDIARRAIAAQSSAKGVE